MFTENPGVFLADFGVPCSAGAYQFTGLLDAPDDVLSMAGGTVLSTMYSLQMLADDVAAAGIDTGTSLVVNGRSYTVREVISLDDGVFKRLALTQDVP